MRSRRPTPFQDIFLKLQRDLDSFRGEATLLRWIYRVTTNHCLNVIRNRRTESRALHLLAGQGELACPGDVRLVEHRDLLRHLLRALR